MWKDFFYFSRGQRVGIAVFIGVILLTVIVRSTLPLFLKSQPVWMTKSFQAETDSFLRSVEILDSLKEVRYKSGYKKSFSYPGFSKENNQIHLDYFDPNSVDSIGLIRIGIRPYVAKNILKFRSKGGRFKNAADFSKIYGIQPDQFKLLEPYIRIKLIPGDTLSSSPVENIKPADTPVFVELNSADTTQLMLIKGVGKYLATAIVRFRQQTGGFVDIQQLKHIKGLTDQHFEQISPFCSVDARKINKIKVNIASVDKLKSHPYLGFYKAKSLYEYRRKVGKLKNIDEIEELDDFSPEDIQKIRPYLSFE